MELPPSLRSALRLFPLALFAVVGPFSMPAADDPPSPIQGSVTIHADQPIGTISRDIYGQFSEHIGRGVYEGIWVGENSPIPNTRGIRNDVVAALKRLRLPVLRWPGGCFADEYHWRDGIGPREGRPVMINSHWGGVAENNAFGTHEFFDLCEQLGCEAYVCGNLGSGSPQEMMEWVEYMTSPSQSTLANLRRQHGRDQPWKVKYFGVGNESWGCGGNMTAEYYANEFRRYNTFVKDYTDDKLLRVACGPNADDYHWTDVLMQSSGQLLRNLSLHYYALAAPDWDAPREPATGFPARAWFTQLRRALRMEEIVSKHVAIMDRHDPKKKVGLVVDEWGSWYDTEPGMNPKFLYQQNSLRDALVAAMTLDIFQEHCDRITMANIAQTINVLQAMILTDKERMVLTPTYHVFDLYQVHQGATALPVDVSAPEYRQGGASIPSVHATASRDQAGRLHLSVVNLLPEQGATVAVKLVGAAAKHAAGQILTASTLDAHNTFDAPDNVKPAPFTAFIWKDGALTMDLPARSVVVIGLD